MCLRVLMDSVLGQSFRPSICIAADSLHLAVLIPTSSYWPEGRAAVGAISLAVETVNADNMLGGKELTFSWKQIPCSPPAAMNALTAMLQEGPVDAVIGPDCSSACESTAMLTRGLRLAQVSYSCSSIGLSNKDNYPTVSPTTCPQACAGSCIAHSPS